MKAHVSESSGRGEIADVRKQSISTLVAQLKSSAKTKDSERLKLLHSAARRSGLHTNIYIANTLISTYSSCGDTLQASRVFTAMKHKTVVSWTALMLGYVENGESLLALELLDRMDCEANRVTFVAAVKACTCLGTKLDKETCLQKGKTVHKLAKTLGFDRDVVVGNTLIDMYSKLGDMLQARNVFNNLEIQTVVSWNILIRGYVENGESVTALDVFNRMDCAADRLSFLAALQACGASAAGNNLEKKDCFQNGTMVHRQVTLLGLDKDVAVASTLVDMYSKCGDMQRARCVFDRMKARDVVSWTALVVGYVDNGECMKALEVFESMDCAANSVTFVAALKACTVLATENKLEKRACLQKGVSIHNQARKLGFHKDLAVSNTLMDVYRKCGEMDRARGVFDGMTVRDAVSWNVLILGYAENGESSRALEAFKRMDCPANCITFVAALKACSALGAVKLGQSIHDRVCELGWERDEQLATCLVDFYGKCGDMNSAEDVFNRLHRKDVVAWNSLIAGYSLRGDTSQVFGLVKRMEASGLKLRDRVTVQLILSACSHAGLVDEGREFFESMSKHGLEPTVEHYGCMVDMLGRANRLEEALAVVRRMTVPPNHVVWTSLLGACRKWNNREIGKVAFDALVALNEDEGSVSVAHVLMRDIFQS